MGRFSIRLEEDLGYQERVHAHAQTRLRPFEVLVTMRPWDATTLAPSRRSCGERDWQKLREFQKRAHTAGHDLRTLNSHLDRTMDSISTNEWTARSLGEVAREEDIENNSGAITLFINKGMSIFDDSKPSAEELVTLQYIRHLSQVKNDIDVLITEADLSVLPSSWLQRTDAGVLPVA
ncbi:hypothetical protein BKA61DRAFT_584836 [Leptodontidium sp. MPI-SDFR-AT-0119]|nr:hypothetical protein BKA61DRAFT_584836 [Leptodontidium sp. MPI-SDFR-AT-0119]